MISCKIYGVIIWDKLSHLLFDHSAPANSLVFAFVEGTQWSMYTCLLCVHRENELKYFDFLFQIKLKIFLLPATHDSSRLLWKHQLWRLNFPFFLLVNGVSFLIKILFRSPRLNACENDDFLIQGTWCAFDVYTEKWKIIFHHKMTNFCARLVKGADVDFNKFLIEVSTSRCIFYRIMMKFLSEATCGSCALGNELH